MQSAEQLVEGVVEDLGLSDLGGNNFMTGLEALLNSVERDAALDDVTVAQLESIVRRRIGNRLLIEAWYSGAGAEVADDVEGPLSIMGLPRTGTTAVGNAMSLDQQFRPLRLWEQMEPWPPPELATELDDPRRLAYVTATEAMKEQRPELEAMHLYDADATTEDVHLLGLEFRSQEMTIPALSFHRWWRDQDMTDAYRYHRRAIGLLQSQRPPNRWLFKSPYHCYHLEAILGVYPDAKFVMTHRDPLKAIPSAVSFVTALFPPGVLARHDLHELGVHYAEHLRIGLEREIEARQRIGPGRILDLHHRDYIADPMGQLERIYEFAGLELTTTPRRAMERWHQKNRGGSHGVHRYTAEQFGLSDGQLRSDFKFYTDEYGIVLEEEQR